jgi:hypothetical protein
MDLYIRDCSENASLGRAARPGARSRCGIVD